MTESIAIQRDPIEVAEREVVFGCGSLRDAEVTVCITLYNYESHIVEALESVHEQTLERLGLVVLDDASTDRSAKSVERWLQAFGGRFSGACLTRHARNAGLARARNGAIDTAESDYVMVLDADNHLHRRCVERLLRSLEDSAHGFAYSVVERFGELQGLMGTSSWCSELLAKGNYIDAMALLRKQTWRLVGGYNRMVVGGWEDYDFWCKCVEQGIRGLFVPELLARYRQHRTSMLATETERGQNSRRVRTEMMERHPWLDLGV
jgi:glycosyltransferase involved in cell wall biosynthesis